MYLLFSPFTIIEEALLSLLMVIDAKIYGLFAKLYSLYLELAMARIFDMDAFKNVISNVYVIFGVVALFIVVFSLLQAMVNPDSVAKGTQTTKEVIKRLIMCVGLTCIVPFGFDFLYDVQYSILSYQVIPKTLIGIGSNDSIDVSESYTDSEGVNQTIETEMSASDFAKAGLQVYGNQMAFYVLNGFLYPLAVDDNGNPADVVVDASKYFNAETGIWGGIIGCAVGIIVTAGLAISGVGIPAAATTALGTAGICAGGVVAGVVINGALISITADKFSWNYISQYMIQYYGEFDWITPFAKAVTEGTMAYTPIVSTIAGVIMLYMLFSFCLDLGVRAAKLAFYQIIAPISFLLSILPKNKDLMSNWFKLVLSTWAEVFVRIICVCGSALLISNLNFAELDGYGYVARAIIVLGIVAFARQAPKLFSEVTGIKSGNLKLGIRDKLKEGGFFAATNAVGGLIAGKGNPLAAYRAGKQGWKDGNFKGIGAEAKRRYEYKQARAAGATRTQMALNAVRGAFGFDSTADASERSIKEQKRNIKNTSPYGFSYDHNGVKQTIDTNGEVAMNEQVVESMTSAIKVKSGQISQASARTGQIDKSIKWATEQKSLKKAFESDADDKWKEGKYSIDVAYQDLDGQVHVESITGNRFTELSSSGVSFLDTSKSLYITDYIDENGVSRQEKMNMEQIKELRRRGLKVTRKSLDKESILTAMSDDSTKLKTVLKSDIEDVARTEWIASELSSSTGSGDKSVLEGFLDTLQKEGGFSYRSFEYDASGRPVRNADGSIKEGEKGSYSSSYTDDGRRKITKTSVVTGADGKEKTTILEYVEAGNGEFSYEVVDSNGNKVTKYIDAYKIASDLKKKSDSTNAVLTAEKSAIEREEIDELRNEIDAMNTMIKTYNEEKDAALQSNKQRGKEASKRYMANRK